MMRDRFCFEQVQDLELPLIRSFINVDVSWFLLINRFWGIWHVLSFWLIRNNHGSSVKFLSNIVSFEVFLDKVDLFWLLYFLLFISVGHLSGYSGNGNFTDTFESTVDIAELWRLRQDPFQFWPFFGREHLIILLAFFNKKLLVVQCQPINLLIAIEG